MRPLISCITPCYHMDRYLRLFLEKLPEQSCFDHLQIVLDHNDPTSDELKWIKDFSARYPGKIKHMVHPVVPIGTSMNLCIREADADVVAIWNVDDLRTPDSLERQFDVLQGGAGVAYGAFTIVRSFGAREGALIPCLDYADGEYTRSMVFGPFIMFRKSLCEKAGVFDEQLKSGADFDLSVRLALHARCARAEGMLGWYLDAGEGLSTRSGGLQPVERTVIELRYGIYDKIDLAYLPRAAAYSIPYLLQYGEWRSITDFVPQWQEMLAERKERWLDAGVAANFWRGGWRARFCRLARCMTGGAV